MGAERKYRVLQVHNFYQIPGGEDTVLASERKLLEDRGHTVLQYTRSNSELNGISGWKRLLLPFAAIFNPKTYRDVKRILREERIDIVHVHNTLPLVSPAVYYAALKRGVPVVQTMHNFRLLCPGATFYRDGKICEDCVKRGLRCAVRHRCYRDSAAQTLLCVVSMGLHRLTGVYGRLSYICLTEFNRKKLLMLRQIRPERTFVKPNFVEAAAEILPAGQRPKQFIFVGRLDRLKGVELLLEAWKRLGADAPRLLICGAGPMEEWCRAYIEENRLSSVEMLGFVPNDRAKRLIAGSRALILPTQWYEGFPMTIAEAYSVGTPVIGSDMGNVGDLVVEGVSGFKFRYDSAEDLARAVGRAEKSELHAERAYEKYGCEASYRTLMEIYSGVLRAANAER